MVVSPPLCFASTENKQNFPLDLFRSHFQDETLTLTPREDQHPHRENEKCAELFHTTKWFPASRLFYIGPQLILV
ncbi:hypothetical protein GLYMA_16G037300v4 [Glycine max]|uniref:Uncharacterized protein n=2 Tax=Glycine subgen. Soja TaxID=1462606 RepID=K7MF28_SOYBN|nr:hypothetical protein JHK87_044145 [Glycine soja]KAG5107516.1 hypothetical protein JHK84_044423 [Glycine max]KAH1149831.1 hypothetical protein GYH30_044051 [Glycine max]KRH06652.1 hypothetical protein GLYMA_16G037300v4 [Glycine max]RZB59448.1 hypothetical protein D0Y65_042615 [Glycine soja]